MVFFRQNTSLGFRESKGGDVWGRGQFGSFWDWKGILRGSRFSAWHQGGDSILRGRVACLSKPEWEREFCRR